MVKNDQYAGKRLLNGTYFLSFILFTAKSETMVIIMHTFEKKNLSEVPRIRHVNLWKDKKFQKSSNHRLDKNSNSKA